jgi:hypothetical protein
MVIAVGKASGIRLTHSEGMRIQQTSDKTRYQEIVGDGGATASYVHLS